MQQLKLMTKKTRMHRSRAGHHFSANDGRKEAVDKEVRILAGLDVRPMIRKRGDDMREELKKEDASTRKKI